MGKLTFMLAGVIGALSLNGFAETKIVEKLDDSSDDTSVLIQRKRNVSIEKDFETISESEEIVGETVGGRQDARKSWDQACAKWKAETRENHKDSKDTKVISVNCGRPQLVKDPSNNGNYSYESLGKYTIRVRMRDAR